MIIEMSLNPNCSEAVMRFFTLEPKKIQEILQAIADEVSANNDFWGKQKVPLFKTVEEYDTNYGGKPSYGEQYGADGKEKMTEEEATKKAYPKGALLQACAGLGDNARAARRRPGPRVYQPRAEPAQDPGSGV